MGEYGGFVKLHRKIANNQFLMDNPQCRLAFEDLIIFAKYEDGEFFYKGRLIKGKRGMVYRSLSSLADRWGWSRDKTRNVLKMLESEGMIELCSSRQQTTIKVVNYERYQGLCSEEDGFPHNELVNELGNGFVNDQNGASHNELVNEPGNGLVNELVNKSGIYKNNKNIKKVKNTNSDSELSISAPTDSDEDDTDNERMTDEEWYRMMEEQYGPEER